jgi:hypothetical protein
MKLNKIHSIIQQIYSAQGYLNQETETTSRVNNDIKTSSKEHYGAGRRQNRFIKRCHAEITRSEEDEVIKISTSNHYQKSNHPTLSIATMMR